jgi:hypothetical protein
MRIVNPPHKNSNISLPKHRPAARRGLLPGAAHAALRAHAERHAEEQKIVAARTDRRVIR